MRKPCVILYLIVALFEFSNANSAHSTIIEREFIFDLTSDWNYGRIGVWDDIMAWEGTISIDDLSISAGDTLIVHIGFANNLSLELTDLGNGTAPTEITKMTLSTDDPIDMRNEWRNSYTATFLDVNGGLLTNPLQNDINGGGSGLSPIFDRTNLTETSFSYSGVDLEFYFDEYLVTRGSAVFTKLEWSSGAELVTIIPSPSPVPEPSTILLFGIGLLGLTGFSRRKKIKVIYSKTTP